MLVRHTKGLSRVAILGNATPRDEALLTLKEHLERCCPEGWQVAMVGEERTPGVEASVSGRPWEEARLAVHSTLGWWTEDRERGGRWYSVSFKVVCYWHRGQHTLAKSMMALDLYKEVCALGWEAQVMLEEMGEISYWEKF